MEPTRFQVLPTPTGSMAMMALTASSALLAMILF
jgi:hypothetical protein